MHDGSGRALTFLSRGHYTNATKLPRDAAAAISRHRARTEKRLARLLEEPDRDATLDQIKSAIFNEDGKRPFAEYVIYLIGLFGAEADNRTDDLIPVIQDAWNYFPHGRLHGSCPAEVILQHLPSLKPGDLR
jgi:hypothetical protein